MACMEHICTVKGCDWGCYDNTPMGRPCPEHGWDNMRHFWDEEYTYRADWPEEDDDAERTNA